MIFLAINSIYQFWRMAKERGWYQQFLSTGDVISFADREKIRKQTAVEEIEKMRSFLNEEDES